MWPSMWVPRKDGHEIVHKREVSQCLLSDHKQVIFESTKATSTSSPMRTTSLSHAPTPAAQPLPPVIVVSTACEWNLIAVSSFFV